MKVGGAPNFSDAEPCVLTKPPVTTSTADAPPSSLKFTHAFTRLRLRSSLRPRAESRAFTRLFLPAEIVKLFFP